jgi:periplasmic protein TonB
MRSISIICFLLLASASIFGQSNCPDRTTPRDRPLEIVEKPKASYPKDMNAAVQGTVTLRVEFRSNARLGKISVVKGLPYGLTEQAIQAARQIKFKPELKSCKAVDTFRPVSYTFERY